MRLSWFFYDIPARLSRNVLFSSIVHCTRMPAKISTYVEARNYDQQEVHKIYNPNLLDTRTLLVDSTVTEIHKEYTREITRVYMTMYVRISFFYFSFEFPYFYVSISEARSA